MDWLAKMIDLPKEFLHSSEGNGGGVIQGSASEAILVAVLAAREQTVKRIQALYPEMAESDIRGKLIAYSSDQSNSAIEKSGILATVPIRLLTSDENGVLTGETLLKAIEEDIAIGRIPVICIATLGTTGTCAFDKVDELGPICRTNNIWLHIDAAYAGAAFCCPEYRHLMKGIDYVDSFNFNLHKWMLVNFDCSAMWIRNSEPVVDSFNVDRIYLKHQYQGKTKVPDYRHWQLALGRKFRALKIWIVLRSYGIDKIRANIRAQIALAQRFEYLVSGDSRFEIVGKPSMGLVVFRVKNSTENTKLLLERITERKLIYMIPATVKDQYVIRFVICGMAPAEKDIDFAWSEIQNEADKITNEQNSRVVKELITTELQKDIIDKMTGRFSSEVAVSVDNNEKAK